MPDWRTAVRERLDELYGQFLCDRVTFGFRDSSRQSSLRMAVPVWPAAGTAPYDSDAEIQAEKSFSLSQIYCSRCICAGIANCSHGLYGDGETCFLPVYLSGRDAGGRYSSAVIPWGAQTDDRLAFYTENGDSGDYLDRMYIGLPFFL